MKHLTFETVSTVCENKSPNDRYVDTPKELLERKRSIFRKKLADAGFVPREEIIPAIDTVINYAAKASLHRHYAHYLKEESRYWRAETVPPYRPPSRGILLCGTCGTGKTMLTETIAKHGKNHFGNDYSNGFIYRTATEIVEAYNSDGQKAVDHFRGSWEWQPLFIDDLGVENEGMHYGVKWGMKEFLLWRYECWKGKYSATTLFTTNASGIDDLVSHYGGDERLKSRITEMCLVVHCNCDDWRLLHPAGK